MINPMVGSATKGDRKQINYSQALPTLHLLSPLLPYSPTPYSLLPTP
ncbi:MAG: hypothetical protein F6J90_15825 [Moorea sp. SIOASIH]|nr:hypothetical protein [Moorena sp. SIOASIH]NEO37717.1 hypothetical protein [Moorena sp. SIOASIH]